MIERRPHDIDSLTDVALRVFADRGYDGATMDDVARAAGITKAAIYHHVSGKEALLDRGLRRALAALDAILAEPEARHGPPAACVRHIVRRVAETTLALLPELTVLFGVRDASEIQRAALARRRTFDRQVATLVERAQAAGTIRRDLDARLLVRLVFGMSNSVVHWYGSGSAFEREAVVAAMVTLAFDGLAPAVTSER